MCIWIVGGGVFCGLLNSIVYSKIKNSLFSPNETEEAWFVNCRHELDLCDGVGQWKHTRHFIGIGDVPR